MSDSAQESQKRHFSKIRPHVLVAEASRRVSRPGTRPKQVSEPAEVFLPSPNAQLAASRIVQGKRPPPRAGTPHPRTTGRQSARGSACPRDFALQLRRHDKKKGRP